MPGEAHGYTFDHTFSDDDSVEFLCTSDPAGWRWLELAPSHPIFIQTFNYFISVECGAARQTRDPSKWSALTWMDWEMGDPNAGLPVRGKMQNSDTTDSLAFEKWLYDAEDRLVYRAAGRGVVFRNRNFEGWRQKSKDELDVRASSPEITFASRDSVGALDGEQALISDLSADATIAEGLVTHTNGMPPGSRYLDGSGDHVNAVHIGEIGRQYCALLSRDPQIQLDGGEISFNRYVEMNVPFEVRLLEHTACDVRLGLKQAGRACAELRYRMRDN